jgi:hypothetical protein
MRSLWLIAIGSVLCGCGGSGGGSAPAPVAAPAPPVPVATPAPAPAPPPTTTADFGGVWFGTLNYGAGGIDEVVALTTSSGRLAIVAIDTAGPSTLTQYAGVATVSGQQVTGTGTMYAGASHRWPGSGTVLPITLELTITERRTLSGRLRSGTVLDAQLSLDYDGDTHGRASSLMQVVGVWYVYDEMLNPMVTVSIEPDGRFLEQNRNGCQSSGQVSLIDPRYNVYAWDAMTASCLASGGYSGLGTIIELDPLAPPALLVTIASPTSAILLPLER